MNTYNYAENEPIANIDLWGLQAERASLLQDQQVKALENSNITRDEYEEDLQEQSELVISILAYTDANDVSVIGTGKNIDGSEANTFDKVGAAIGIIAPVVSGSLIGKGLQKIFGNSIDKVDGAAKVEKDFVEAREEAFNFAGLKNGDVELSKIDPATGTIVEFKGRGGAKVGYDGPHPGTPGPHHDTQHISTQKAGRRPEGGQRLNIPYSGPQHPSRPNKKP